MKKIFWILAILFLLGGGLYLALKLGNQKNKNLLSVVPANAVFMLETDNMTDAWDKIHDDPIWTALIHTKGFEDLQDADQSIQSVFENGTTKYLIENQPFLMSAHIVAGNDWNFLYVLDLKKNFRLEDWLKLAGKKSVYKKINVEGQNLWKIKTGKDTYLYLYPDKNLLAFSFSYQIMRLVIQERDKRYWENNTGFSFVKEKTPDRPVKFYFNYNQLPDFLSLYFQNDFSDALMTAQALAFTGLGIDRDGNLIDGEGLTTVNDSIHNYLTALLHIEPSEQSAQEILPDNTALYFSVSFKDFYNFLDEMKQAQFGNSASKRSAWRKQQNQLEKWLGIDLDKDVFSWIGNEIASVNITDSRLMTTEPLLLIHLKNPQLAKEKMDEIVRKIRKRTPFRFKNYTYKNFPINYLAQKSFFKMILGNIVKDLGKPYFIFVENYLVLGRSEQVLKNFIDHYITGQTLDKQKEFSRFYDQAKHSRNLTLYVHTPYFYPLFYHNVSKETQASLKKYEKLWRSFNQAALVLKNDKKYFDTQILVEHDTLAYLKHRMLLASRRIDEQLHTEIMENINIPELIPDSVLNVNDKVILRYLDGSIKAEGMAWNGKPNAIWRFYYPSGSLKAVLHFTDGKLDGENMYYYESDRPSQMIIAEFEDGKLNGEYSEFWPNGAHKALIFYKNGEKHGSFTLYYPDGSVKVEGKYRHNKKKGLWKFYDKDGKIKNKMRFSLF